MSVMLDEERGRLICEGFNEEEVRLQIRGILAYVDDGEF